MMEWIKTRLGNQADIVFAIGVISILLMLFVPIHPALLDALLITNFSAALLILLLTFYVDKPLDFSTFPSLILIATLFRLALNISATRLILSDANAGKVIGAIGEHVVQGNYVIGAIVFLVLIVVQYVVVTNGAQRVAEVAARFTLDSMPGKQMSIDADLNAGLIDEDTARARRLQIEKEGNFYGAMDGASKFVKGDAIAGIVIVIIDIIGGLTIGVAQMGMKWGDAAHTFTLLTIGDGIVTQIPALIISTATGIIVTRASSDNFLSKEIGRQVTAYPKTLLMVTSALLIILVVPGIPAAPVLVLLTIFGLLSFFMIRNQLRTKAMESAEKDDSVDEAEESFDNLYRLKPIELKVGAELSGLFENENSKIFERISNFRKQYAKEFGFVFPKVTVLREKSIGENDYEILINGASLGKYQLYLNKCLVISQGGVSDSVVGKAVRDPAYGLPAKWINERDKNKISIADHTVVDAETVLITHVVELLKRNISEFLTRAETERLIDLLRKEAPNLVDELVPSVMSVGQIQSVLQMLVKEKVPIHNLAAIFEVLVEAAKAEKRVDHLVELVRRRLSTHISQSLTKGSGRLSVLTLDSEVELKLAQSIVRSNENEQVVIEPRMLEQLLRRLSARVEEMMKENLYPVLLTAPEVRRHIKKLTERSLPQLSVVSMGEVSDSVELQAFATVKI